MTHSRARLEVIICGYGEQSLQKIARSEHPKMKDVAYLVCLQTPSNIADLTIPEELSNRDDVKILVHNSRGLSKNRNFGFQHASGEILLISDDDLSYTREGLESVMESFDNHPDAQILTFRYHTIGAEDKPYPEAKEFDLREPLRGYYVSSVEIALRRSAIKDLSLCFDEDFEIGGRLFNSGGEEVFVHCALKKGARCIHIPIYICEHTGASTGVRTKNTREAISAKGGVMAILHPASWPLRIIKSAWTARKEINIMRYIAIGFQGAIKLLRRGKR